MIQNTSPKCQGWEAGTGQVNSAQSSWGQIRGKVIKTEGQ